MPDIFDDLDEAIEHSYRGKTIGWLEVADRKAADKMLSRIKDEAYLNSIETTETVVESRPVVHVSGKIIDSDFQIYLVWRVVGGA